MGGNPDALLDVFAELLITAGPRPNSIGRQEFPAGLILHELRRRPGVGELYEIDVNRRSYSPPIGICHLAETACRMFCVVAKIRNILAAGFVLNDQRTDRRSTEVLRR